MFGGRAVLKFKLYVGSHVMSRLVVVVVLL